MNKKSRSGWQIRDIAAFSVSMFATIGLLSYVLLYYFGIRPVREVNDYATKTVLPKLHLLFVVPEFELSYGLDIDFEKQTTTVQRLYVDTNAYSRGGLSEMVARAEDTLSTEFTGAIAVSDTQLAAIIDYVGGVGCNVDKRISSICGGASIGWSNLHGVAAIRLFEAERENEALCLTFAEELLEKWCKTLHNKRSFFRLLDLSDHNLSYTDYLPLVEHFEKFKD